MLDHYSYITVKLDRASRSQAPSPNASPGENCREVSVASGGGGGGGLAPLHVTARRPANSGSSEDGQAQWSASARASSPWGAQVSPRAAAAAGGFADAGIGRGVVAELSSATSTILEPRPRRAGDGGATSNTLDGVYAGPKLVPIITPAPSPGLWPSSPYSASRYVGGPTLTRI